MTIFAGIAGTDQRNQVVHSMRVRCPDLAAVDHPAAVTSFGARADCGEIRTGVRLAHADAEEAFAAADARDDRAFRLLAAMAQDLWTRLAIGNPMCPARRTSGEHLFGHDEPHQARLRSTTVLLWPGDAMKPAAPTRALKAASKVIPDER